MYVEGRVLDIHGKPVPNASIETWETDSEGAALYGILRPSYVADDGGGQRILRYTVFEQD